MKLYARCTKSEFPIIDMFIHSWEFNERPNIDEVELTVMFDKIYQYEVQKIADKFYFTTFSTPV